MRDNIVQLNIAMGGEVKYKTLSGDKLTKALLKKLTEESNELRNSDLSVGELADLKQLVEALADHLGIKRADLAKRQVEKRKQNGAF